VISTRETIGTTEETIGTTDRGPSRADGSHVWTGPKTRQGVLSAIEISFF
jgi:hypothetical protein